MVFQFYLKLPDDAMVARDFKPNITKSCSKMPKTDEIRGKLSKKYSKCHMLIWQPTTRKGNAVHK